MLSLGQQLIVLTAFLVVLNAQGKKDPQVMNPKPLRVAFVVSTGFNMIDFAGPWEVFNDARLPTKGKSWEESAHLFELYTVSDSVAPIKSGGGANFIPQYNFANAPKPDIVVIGAQRSNSPELYSWLKKQHADGNVLMSVCTGAFKLARSGLLDGKSATSHHAYVPFYRDEFPKIVWLETRRFVQSSENIYTAGGLTSGIDLALHVVAKKFGTSIAQATADWMEYQGAGWKNPE